MFYLLVVLIAIALIGVVTATTSSYIGDAFESGSADAKAVTLINGGSQISAATALYETQGNGTMTSLSALISENYLSALPEAPNGLSWSRTQTGGDIYAVAGSPGTATCSAVNERGGIGETPVASTPLGNGIGEKFGCDGAGMFFYKL